MFVKQSARIIPGFLGVKLNLKIMKQFRGIIEDQNDYGQYHFDNLEAKNMESAEAKAIQEAATHRKVKPEDLQVLICLEILPEETADEEIVEVPEDF